MNQKEVEARLIAIEADGKVHTETHAMIMNSIEAFRTALEGLHERFTRLEVMYAELATAHAGLVEESHGSLYGFEAPAEGVPEDETDEQRATRIGLVNRVGEIEALVRGRNRSAPTKRSMTDEDARRVLVGDVKEMGHKEAGEAIGLTYAQVYSARLEYTFKHVHKELRDGGWKNPWAQKK